MNILDPNLSGITNYSEFFRSDSTAEDMDLSFGLNAYSPLDFDVESPISYDSDGNDFSMSMMSREYSSSSGGSSSLEFKDDSDSDLLLHLNHGSGSTGIPQMHPESSQVGKTTCVKDEDIDITSLSNCGLSNVSFPSPVLFLDYDDLISKSSFLRRTALNQAFVVTQDALKDQCLAQTQQSSRTKRREYLPQNVPIFEKGFKVKSEEFFFPEVECDRAALRRACLLRYQEKKRNRQFSKKIRYTVRKLNAEKRPRVKGRFVKLEETKPGESKDCIQVDALSNSV
mmetsp:Transcript_28627/g.39551  ORF Transcript_28627/g.39551 Transcript_28627/m.39551 type:complete len:284 (+) Transcript_28627:229-1080(+)|eukprot:CAMPEP_0196590516 /NCGR_PEP_ID=MMETSP1081-20130531/66856_1 /TAXON_ID=36882 /ORGANISM="Pyramimonas amylifera, Strain CCMP720" /LENGTH=283 /DNA_ID=CAMNT_0041913647 /DNA_START=158 /DNA_END=1009 /DNA_ORIENTATION=+